MKYTEQELNNEVTRIYPANTMVNFLCREAFVIGYQQAISQMQPEWVSVQDRLPEINQQVLVVDKGKVKYAVYEQQGDYRLFFIEKDGILHYSNVTHWMPLPSQPQTK